MSLLCMQGPDKHLAEAWEHTLHVISWAGVNGWYMSSNPIAQPCRKHQARLPTSQNTWSPSPTWHVNQ